MSDRDNGADGAVRTGFSTTASAAWRGVGDVVMPRYWVATTDRTWGIRLNFIRPGSNVTDQYLQVIN
jgi:hypothetical protein